MSCDGESSGIRTGLPLPLLGGTACVNFPRGASRRQRLNVRHTHTTRCAGRVQFYFGGEQNERVNHAGHAPLLMTRAGPGERKRSLGLWVKWPGTQCVTQFDGRGRADATRVRPSSCCFSAFKWLLSQVHTDVVGEKKKPMNEKNAGAQESADKPVPRR